MRRVLAVLLGGVAVTALLLAFAMSWGVFEPPDPNPAIRPAATGPPRWKETKRYLVNSVLIVEGEAADVERALEIAKWLIEPAGEAYDEVLVYVRTPGDDARTRRVQWTKRDGYRVLDYGN